MQPTAQAAAEHSDAGTIREAAKEDAPYFLHLPTAYNTIEITTLTTTDVANGK
jgi:hypothetical protein